MRCRTLLALALASASVHAADNPLRLDTLTVTADRARLAVPLAVTRIDADSLIAASPRSLHDLLLPAAGLFAQNRNNAAQGLRVAIRGFGARAAFGVRGIRVSLDGVPLTLPDGQTELDSLDLGLIDSATVIRGPAASLYGNAAGGVIELRSRPIDGSQHIGLLAERHDTQRLRAELSHAGETNGLRLAVRQLRSGGPRRHADTDSSTARLRWERAAAGGELAVFLGLLDITADDPGALTAGQARENRRAAAANNLRFNAGERIRQQRLGLHWRAETTAAEWEISGFLAHREFANRLPFESGGQVSFDRDAGGFAVTATRPQSGPFGLTHRLSGGVDLQLQADDRRRFDNLDGRRGPLTLDQRERAETLGLLLRDSVRLARHWHLSAGLRHDWLELSVNDRFLDDGNDSGKRRLTDFSYDASLSRDLGQQQLHLRYATAFQTPTFNELANPDGGGFNSALDSSTARNLELGLQGQLQRARYALSLFRITSSDELQPFELEGQSGRSFFRNSGRTERDGVELTAHLPIATRWKIDLAYSYLDAEFAGGGEQEGNRLPGLPRQHAWLSLGHRLGAWQLDASVEAVNDIALDDANSATVAGYALLHARARWNSQGETGRWTVKLAIDNLLDKDHNDNVRINAFGGRALEPAGGRTWRIGIDWRH